MILYSVESVLALQGCGGGVGEGRGCVWGGGGPTGCPDRPSVRPTLQETKNTIFETQKAIFETEVANASHRLSVPGEKYDSSTQINDL